MRILRISLLCSLLFSFVMPAAASATETVNIDLSDMVEDGIVEDGSVSAISPIKKKIEETFAGKAVSPFEILGHTIEPGTIKTFQWPALQSSIGKYIEMPVIVINGTEPGPVLTLTAAIHGDELNGIEMIRQVMHELDPARLKGTIVGIPIVNLEGFWRKERYLGDRKDLNRYFPGNPKGSYPSRVAHLIFSNFIERSDMVVDIHTGSFFRENLPQLRVDLKVDQIAKLATGFGAVTALQSRAPSGSLRGAATAAGIPAVVMEIGGPLSLETDMVTTGVKSLRTFLQSVGMITKVTLWPRPQPVFYSSEWVRAEVGGILINRVGLGDTVRKGTVLAEISNPLDNSSHSVISSIDGTVLGRAQNQFVSPGFALFHIGHKKSVEEIEKEIETEPAPTE